MGEVELCEGGGLSCEESGSERLSCEKEGWRGWEKLSGEGMGWGG